jgi:precorrin-6A synthase
MRNAGYRTVAFKTPRRADPDEGYRASVDEWHAKLEACYESLFTQELAEGERGAFLVWGDPALYDSTLRIVETIRSKGFALDYEVIPGITAVQALAAQHRIALNRIGGPVLITTGRRIAEGIPAGVGDVVVMLDGEQAFKRVAPGDLDIYWGAYLGTDDEILVSGRLSEVMDDIVRIRSEAREKHGWIMDTYLLRKAEPS